MKKQKMRKLKSGLLTMMILCATSCFVACKPADSSSSESIENPAGSSSATDSSTLAGDSSIEDSTQSSADTSETPDTTAPVITINGEKSYTISSGESFTLPTATVIDDVDGDISATVYQVLADGAKFASLKDGVFTSNVGGRHEIVYYAEDKAQNEAYETIVVQVQTATDDEQKDNVSKDMAVLDESGATFFENFEQGPQNTLMKNAYKPYFTLTGDEKAISGNSLIIDYSELEKQTNRINLSSLMPYLKTGRWTVEFDVKLVSGEGFEDFFFAYNINGEESVNSYGKRYDLSDMEVGDVRHITYQKVFEILEEEEGQYYFYLYKVGTEYIESVLAFDNFTFRWEELPYTTYVPTLNELQEGFTYDWSDEKYATLGEPVQVTDIQDENVKNAIMSADGFGDRVMHLTSSSLLNGILSANNALFFEPNKVITLDINYYTVAKKGDSYLTVFNGDATNRTLQSDVFYEVGTPSKTSVRYITGSGETGFYFYTWDEGWDIYVGEITITIADRMDIDMKDQYKELTSDDLSNGYIFDMALGNIPYLQSGYCTIEYYELAKIPDAQEMNSTAQGYFTSGYALKMSGYAATTIECFNDKVQQGTLYGVEWLIWSKEELDGNIYLLALDAAKEQLPTDASAYRLGIVSLGNGMYRISGYIAGDNMAKYLAFYSARNFDFYVASLNIYTVDYAGFDSVTKETVEQGYTSNFNEKFVEIASANANNRWGMDNANWLLNVEMDYAGRLDLKFTKGVFETGKTYNMSLTVKREQKGDLCLLLMNGYGQQVGSAEFVEKQVENGYSELIAVFEAEETYAYAAVFNRAETVEKFQLARISLAVETDTRADENVTSEIVNGDGYVSNFANKKFAFGGSAVVNSEKISNNYTYYILQESGKTPEFDLLSLNNTFIAGNTYRLTFTASVIRGGTLVVLTKGVNGQIGEAHLAIALETNDGDDAYTYEFIAPEGCLQISVFCMDGIQEMYLKSIALVKVEIPDTFQPALGTVDAINIHFETSDSNAQVMTGIDGVDASETAYLHVSLAQYGYLDFLNFANVMDVGKKYTLTFNAYESTGAMLVLLQMDETNAQIGATYANLNKIDLGNGYYTFESTFTALENLHNVRIFVLDGAVQEMYISTVTLTEIEDISTGISAVNLLPVTSDTDVQITTGITGIDTSNTSYLHITLSKYENLWFENFNCAIEAGKKYTFAFDAYESIGAMMVLLQINDLGTQVGNAYTSFAKRDLGNGYYTFDATFTALEGASNVMIFVLDGETQKMYISAVQLAEAKGIQVNAADLLPFTSDIDAEITTGITGVDESDTAYWYINLEQYGYVDFVNFAGAFVASETYTLTFEAYETVGASLVLLQLDENNTQVGDSYVAFAKEDLGNGYYRFSATFMATENVNNVRVFVLEGAMQEMYVTCVTLI